MTDGRSKDQSSVAGAARINASARPLEARQAFFGNFQEWYSFKPKNYSELKSKIYFNVKDVLTTGNPNYTDEEIEEGV